MNRLCKLKQISRGISMKKTDDKLMQKKMIFKAWTGILLAKGIIDPARHNQMISLIEKMRK